MSSENPPIPGPSPQPPRARGPGGWAGSIALGVVILAIYLANNRELGTDDTAPTSALAVCLYRGDGFAVDRYLPYWGIRPGDELPDYLARWRGHVISRYPIAPSLLALPFVAFQMAYLDRMSPGWDRTPRSFKMYAWGTTKLAAALIAALAAVVLHRVLREMGLRRVAIPATLAAALGSDLWVVGSQALWQHGPAALALITAVWLLLSREPSRARFVLGGVATAVLVACRLIDVVFALAIFGWVARAHPRRLAWFLPGPVLGAVALLGSNLWIFGTITGGLAHLETVHPRAHAMPAGPWSGDLLAGAAGTLFSPNRGLLVFSPWVGLALATLPFSAGRLAPWPQVRWLLWAIVPYGLLISKYTVWWGGHCFGPRYWTDAIPLFAIILACGLDWSYERCRPVAMAFALAIVASIAVQAIGAFYYPSSWNTKPVNVDLNHARLWDWRDTEVTRCLIEGLR